MEEHGCKCTFVQHVLGIGCPICHPDFWEEQDALIKETDLLVVRDEWREDIAIGGLHTGSKFSVWDAEQVGAWDMLADYFTVE